MMDRNLRTRLQAARWLLERVAAKSPEDRDDFLRSETDDQLLIELVEGLMEKEATGVDQEDHEILLPDIEMGRVDAAELLREINGIPRHLGDFQLSRPVGQGGMGSVFLAEHRSTGIRHAVKVAVGESLEDDGIRSLFRESAIMRTLGGRPGVPGSLPAVSMERDDQVIAYYAREFVRGTCIDDWITAVSPDLQRVLELSIESSVILDSCHRSGVAHADIKPSNLLVGVDGSSVHVIDFGLAVRVEKGQLVERARIGHPGFVAPEVRSSDWHDPMLADQFSMGLTIFTLLSKALHDDPPTAPADSLDKAGLIGSSDLPDVVRAVLERMTREDPSERFVDLASANAALAESLVQIKPRSTPARNPVPRRNLVMASIGVMILIAAGLTGLISGNGWGTAPPEMQSENRRIDLAVALSSLDGGDVAMATSILSSLGPEDDSWLADHLRARINAIYNQALIADETDLTSSMNGRFDFSNRDGVLSTIDVENGSVAHRWPIDPAWEIMSVDQNVVLVRSGEMTLELDIRHSAAAEIVGRDSLVGTLFRSGDADVGWITRSGMVIIRDEVTGECRRMTLPQDIALDRVQATTDGWRKLVIVDGGHSVRVIGIGPGLGDKVEVILDAESRPDQVRHIGQGRFLLFGSSGGAWILGSDDSIEELMIEGTIANAAWMEGIGIQVLVSRGESSSVQWMSESGRFLEGSRPFEADSNLVKAPGAGRAAGSGFLGMDYISGIFPAVGGMESLSEASSMSWVDPRTLLLGGPWRGLWVLDPISGVVQGRIETGGDGVRKILVRKGRSDVYTQDERGFIRRIPA